MCLTEIASLIENHPVLFGAGATLVAGFFGPYFAFKLESNRKKQEEYNQIFSNMNRAIATLVAQWNLAKHLKDVVTPAINKEDAWLNMFAIEPGLYKIIPVDTQALAPLTDWKKSRLFQEIINTEEGLSVTLANLENFSKVAVNTVWPKLEASGIRMGETQVTMKVLTSVIGQDIIHIQKHRAAAVLEEIPVVEEKLKALINQLKAVLKEKFPDRETMDVKFLV